MFASGILSNMHSLWTNTFLNKEYYYKGFVEMFLLHMIIPNKFKNGSLFHRLSELPAIVVNHVTVIMSYHYFLHTYIKNYAVII